jgi:hypothetical protein
VVLRGSQDTLRGCVYGQSIHGSRVSQQLNLGRNLPIVVVPNSDAAVHTRRHQTRVIQELDTLDRPAVSSISARCQNLLALVPKSQQSIVTRRDHALVSSTCKVLASPFSSCRSGREEINTADPVVVFERSDVRRRYQSAYIFDIQGSFGRDAVGGKELIDRGTEELAVDQELKGDGLFGLEQTVHQSGELVSTELCDSRQSHISSQPKAIRGAGANQRLEVLLTSRDEDRTRVLGQLDIRTSRAKLNSHLRRRHVVVYMRVVCLCDDPPTSRKKLESEKFCQIYVLLTALTLCAADAAL